MTFEVFWAVRSQETVFWDVMLCGLVTKHEQGVVTWRSLVQEFDILTSSELQTFSLSFRTQNYRHVSVKRTPTRRATDRTTACRTGRTKARRLRVLINQQTMKAYGSGGITSRILHALLLYLSTHFMRRTIDWSWRRNVGSNPDSPNPHNIQGGIQIWRTCC